MLTALLNKLRPHIELSQLSMDQWRKVVESKLVPTQERGDNVKMRSASRDSSLEGSKQYYKERRRFGSLEVNSCINRSTSDNSIIVGKDAMTKGKIVQGSLKNWGSSVPYSKSLAQRFMKPIRHQLK